MGRYNNQFVGVNVPEDCKLFGITPIDAGSTFRSAMSADSGLALLPAPALSHMAT